MASLKAGSINDFANSLASYMDEVMLSEWQKVNGDPLPNDEQSRTQRRIVFVAVAQGLLKYLDDHLADLITTDDSGDTGLTQHHHAMAFTTVDV